MSSKDSSIEHILNLIEEGTAAAVGEHFLRVLTRRLAATLETRWAFVAELLDAQHCRVLTLWTGHSYEEGAENSLAGTPCEQVFIHGKAVYPRGLQKTFPNDEWLREIGAEAYAAVPLFGADGKPLGHLGVLHDQPLRRNGPLVSVLRIFAARVAAEVERTRTERRLRESEERYRRLVEASPDIVYRIKLGEDFRIEYVNPAIERVLGYSPDEFYADPDLLLSIAGLDDVSDVRKVAAGGAFFEAPVREWRHKDGSQVWTEQHNMPVYDDSGNLIAMEGIARDVTARVLAERELEERRRVAQAFMEAIPDVLFRISPDGERFRLLSANGDAPAGTRNGEWAALTELLPESAAKETRRASAMALQRKKMQSFRYSVNGADIDLLYEVRVVPTAHGELIGALIDETASAWMAAENGHRRERASLEEKVDREARHPNPYAFTFRELSVLHLVAEGVTDKEIANRLGISLFTVNKHVSNILGKMGVSSRTEASVRAVQEKLLS
jgi:PAS domain S-box-containing protein